MPAVALMSDSRPALADSFEEVVRRRETEVLRTAYRIVGNWADAEDIAQEVFLRLHRHGINFANEMALRSWLYRVAVNLCLDRARATRSFEELPELKAEDASAETNLIREQRKRMMMAALGTLPPRERAALVLREIEELSTAEVAAILGSREVTVRTQVAKALDKLRSILNREKA
jgi:RNA polymerase sigma-70 factor (ECF subfamily)